MKIAILSIRRPLTVVELFDTRYFNFLPIIYAVCVRQVQISDRMSDLLTETENTHKVSHPLFSRKHGVAC